jgi:hypothetical protein
MRPLAGINDGVEDLYPAISTRSSLMVSLSLLLAGFFSPGL